MSFRVSLDRVKKKDYPIDTIIIQSVLDFQIEINDEILRRDAHLTFKL